MLDLEFYLNSVNAVGLWLASLWACKEFHNYSVSVCGDRQRKTITVCSRVKCGTSYRAHGTATQRFGTGNE